MKKIFIIGDASSIHIAKWADYFVNRDYDVHIATFARKNITKVNNIHMLSSKKADIRGGNFHYILAIPKIVKLLKNIQPDIVNAHYSYSIGFISLIAKKISNIQCIFSVVCHGSDILIPPAEILTGKINKFVLMNSDKIFAVSDQIRDKIDTFNLKKKHNIYVGQYGVCTKELAKNSKNTKKDIDILSNRAYDPNSRIDELLEYIDQSNMKHLKIVFIVPAINDKNFKILRKKYPYIDFHKHLAYFDMIKMMQRSKIYISNTKSDGTSLSLLESMACGCIPVVSNIVSNRSWILDGINGFLFYNKNEFTEKLKYAINNFNEINFMNDININIIHNKASYINEMQKIEKFLFKIDSE